MWIHVDMTKHTKIPSAAPDIVQVSGDPTVPVTTNGKFIIPTPLDVDFVVDSSSYVLNGAGQVDGGDVSSQAFAQLLARYPQYENIYFNPLITASHIAELDMAFGFVSGVNTFYPRCQTSVMPNNTAILPLNATTTPDRPGLLVTDEIDISAYTLDCDGNPVGASQFMVYWKLLDFTVSHDIAGATIGTGAGLNTPALRQVATADDEPANFTVYMSTDAGSTWCPVGLLEPAAMCERGTSFRLAFRNDSTAKLYIAHFAVMFRADL